MFDDYSFLIIVAIIFIFFVYPQCTCNEKENYENNNTIIYDNLDDHYKSITVENHHSKGNIENAKKDKTQKFKNTETPIITMGTPNPLESEIKPMIHPSESLFYFHHHKSHPSCCGSTAYSSDQGCVCWTPNMNIKYCRKSSAISPSS